MRVKNDVGPGNDLGAVGAEQGAAHLAEPHQGDVCRHGPAVNCDLADRLSPAGGKGLKHLHGERAARHIVDTVVAARAAVAENGDPAGGNADAGRVGKGSAVRRVHHALDTAEDRRADDLAGYGGHGAEGHGDRHGETVGRINRNLAVHRARTMSVRRGGNGKTALHHREEINSAVLAGNLAAKTALVVKSGNGVDADRGLGHRGNTVRLNHQHLHRRGIDKTKVGPQGVIGGHGTRHRPAQAHIQGLERHGLAIRAQNRIAVRVLFIEDIAVRVPLVKTIRDHVRGPGRPVGAGVARVGGQHKVPFAHHGEGETAIGTGGHRVRGQGGLGQSDTAAAQPGNGDGLDRPGGADGD